MVAFAQTTASFRVWWWLCLSVELVSQWQHSINNGKHGIIFPVKSTLNLFFDRCQWNGFLPWPLQLWYLLSQEIMPAKKHTVWVCNLSALSALWGSQSVSHDMGQHPVPEEPGMVPHPVTVWEEDNNRAMLEEGHSLPKCWTALICKCIVILVLVVVLVLQMAENVLG